MIVRFASLSEHVKRISRPAHPYIGMMIVFVVALTLLEYAIGADHNAITLSAVIMQIFLTAGLYRYVSLCAIGITVLSMLTGSFPDIMFPTQLWNAWLAFGLLSYHRRIPLTIVLILMETAGRCYEICRYADTGWTVSGIVTACGASLVAAIIGFSLSQHRYIEHLEKERIQQRHVQQERNRLKRSMLLASKLHDSTTRGLTLIALLADQSVHDDSPSDANAKRLAEMKTTAQSTLKTVREIITLLDGNDAHDFNRLEDSSHSRALGDVLRQMVKDNDRSLSLAGYFGTSDVEVTSAATVDQIMPEAFDEIADFISHMYANIINYATHGEESYYISIIVTDDRCVIRQFNTIDTTPQPTHTGKGLALHRKRIHMLNGILETKIDDDMWILHAEIPL